MLRTIYAVLTDEELIRFAETRDGSMTGLEAELLLRLRSRVDRHDAMQEED